MGKLSSWKAAESGEYLRLNVIDTELKPISNYVSSLVNIAAFYWIFMRCKFHAVNQIGVLVPVNEVLTFA